MSFVAPHHRPHAGCATDVNPAADVTPARGPPPHLSDHLVAGRHLSRGSAEIASVIATAEGLDLGRVLQTRFGLSQRSLLVAEGEALAARIVDPLALPPDAALVCRFGAAAAMACGVLPWRRAGDVTLVLCDTFATFTLHRPALERALGPVRMMLSTRDQITGALSRDHAADLVIRAETRLPAGQSSRNWRAGRAMAAMAAGTAALLGAAIASPATLLAVLSALAVVLLAVNGAVKVAAALAGLRAPIPVPIPAHLHGPSPGDGSFVDAGPLPVITLLIPLYRERAIAEHLLARLKALDYPRELLDVCLVLEDNDTTTRAALHRARVLTWMRRITVPQGTLRTKPRALNYALDFARGSIVGVYDAEDAPAPDQLRVVAATFARAGPRVACLQGVLDYYNSSANWLTRCFTIEYASWFRVVLPGYARLGLVVPLGGTTLFFRRDILDALHGWDAHNVTEDADLGLRLARAGYTTVFIPTVTMEEANGRPWTWVKQRSRWLKGYAVTWCVHMRDPVRLWRDLGAWRFFGVQVLFAGTLSQFLLAPLLWAFWLIPLGLHHPLATLLSPQAFRAMVGLFIAAEVANFAIAALALHRADKRWLVPWALSLQLYFPLGALAVYKGLLELAWKPFYWDKTQHGLLLPPDHRVTARVPTVLASRDSAAPVDADTPAPTPAPADTPPAATGNEGRLTVLPRPLPRPASAA
ncbi:Glycosyltransferase, catalytic subunit of cellulose synthase and poly-beta-1,6-N-acetylglucosamine synthase [Loktanella fryxellensis]|uniref:Glycosyltransferase, catalytic subunit of cellulose synthase and poly-beta-1,6-N-acetylglucosamine synthase n=1 Tax=Loktanella fryxellensis TaxID=245187 RepID=A0A1H8GE63_9RHOB|nr:glycosyltransferase family 2 protein [Loktanella fryxellensis]SEN42326.1 Glycosyltransferase, catalytic subunit of cellulose synthase and poly-beta-1,6-N-acetylglucosamine synthase [Loktanella fryxellensis]